MNLRSALSAVVLAAAAIGIAVPAYAQSVTVVDGPDASGSLSDIRRVTLDHKTDRVVVRTTFTDLTPDTIAGLKINVDTDAGREGPEFVLLTGLGEGTDFSLHRATNWRAVGEPLTCFHRVAINWDTERLRFAASRACLGNPARVRVGEKMTDHTDASHPIVDWMTGVRRWTPWMTRG